MIVKMRRLQLLSSSINPTAALFILVGLGVFLFLLPFIIPIVVGASTTGQVGLFGMVDSGRPPLKIYIVEEGDRLVEIAERYGYDPVPLARYNRIDPDAPLVPGQQLNLPLSANELAQEAASIAEFFIATQGALVQEEAADVAGGPLPIVGLIQERVAAVQALLQPQLSQTNVEAIEGAPEGFELFDRLGEGPQLAPVLIGEAYDPTRNPTLYIVEEGDSLARIAEKFGISVHELYLFNLDNRPDKLFVGKEMRIPDVTTDELPVASYGGYSPNTEVTGFTYWVQEGDTVIIVAQKFGRQPDVIRGANGLVGDYLWVGEQIVIPPDNHLELPGIKEPWRPFDGVYRVSSLFTPDHRGIDFVMPEGTPIKVIADGYVEKIGFDADGYGNYVIVRHSPSIKSLYGHLSTINVEYGQKVDRENVLGLAGNTGQSSSAHLHLEIYEGGRRLNPCFYIKDGCY